METYTQSTLYSSCHSYAVVSLRECLRIHHEAHKGAQRSGKQGKVSANSCNPWLDRVQVSTLTRAQRNFKTLSKTSILHALCAGGCYPSEYNPNKSAEGGNRTHIPGGNTILSRARLPIPPLRLVCRRSRVRGAPQSIPLIR
jgi:hypothetical protein